MDLCHLKNSELEPQLQKYKGRVVLRGDIVIDDAGSYAVLTEQGSSASQMTAAKVMDVIASLPDCAGPAADAVSAYTPVRMENAAKLRQKNRVWMSMFMDIAAKIVVKHWRSRGSSWAKCVRTPTCGPLVNNLLGLGWEKLPNWECLLVHWKQCPCLSVYVDDINTSGCKQNWGPMWKKNSWNLSILKNQHHCLTTCILGCTQREWKPNETIIDEYRKRFESRISAGATENLPGWEKPHAKTVAWSLRYGRTREKNALKDIANWPTKRLSNFTKSHSTPCLDDHHFKKEELDSVGELSRECSQISLKCLHLARTGRSDVLWSVNKLARAVACDKR